MDLLVPTMDHVENSSWSQWFNSQRTNRFTNHAVFPNTIEKQRDFFANLQSGQRLSLLIASKSSAEPIGTVSFSGIDFRHRVASVAIVMDTESDTRYSPLASLEAMAIMTTHGFDVMGLERIEAGQAYPGLAKWNQMLELVGYRAEGIERNKFRRGRQVHDVVHLACLVQTYDRLTAARGGALWPGADAALALIRDLPKRSFTEVLDETHRALEREYFGD